MEKVERKRIFHQCEGLIMMHMTLETAISAWDDSDNGIETFDGHCTDTRINFFRLHVGMTNNSYAAPLPTLFTRKVGRDG